MGAARMAWSLSSSRLPVGSRANRDWSSGAGTRADCIMPPPAHAPRRSASAAAFTPSGTLGGRGAYEQRTENGNREQRMPEKTPEGPLFHSNSNSLFEFSVPARRIAAPVLQLGLRLRL